MTNLRDFARILVQGAPRETREPVHMVAQEPVQQAQTLRQRAAERKRRIREAKALGVQAVTIDNARYELGQPAKAAVTPDTELNEWDRDLGAPSPSSLRQ